MTESAADTSDFLRSFGIRPPNQREASLAVDGKGTIYCLFERGGYKTLTLAKFDLAWLTDGK